MHCRDQTWTPSPSMGEGNDGAGGTGRAPWGAGRGLQHQGRRQRRSPQSSRAQRSWGGTTYLGGRDPGAAEQPMLGQPVLLHLESCGCWGGDSAQAPWGLTVVRGLLCRLHSLRAKPGSGPVLHPRPRWELAPVCWREQTRGTKVLVVQAHGPSPSSEGPEPKGPPSLARLHGGTLCFSAWGNLPPSQADSVGQSCEPLPQPRCARGGGHGPASAPRPRAGGSPGAPGLPWFTFSAWDGIQIHLCFGGEKSDITHENQPLPQTTPSPDRGCHSTGSCCSGLPPTRSRLWNGGPGPAHSSDELSMDASQTGGASLHPQRASVRAEAGTQAELSLSGVPPRPSKGQAGPPPGCKSTQ